MPGRADFFGDCDKGIERYYRIQVRGIRLHMVFFTGIDYDVGT